MNILAIDQGTSATKAIVVDAENAVLGAAEVAVRPQAAGDAVEVDPEQLYESVIEAGRAAMSAARVPVSAVAVANQGETVLAWDQRTGSPLTVAIVWQDRRSAQICQQIASQASRLAQLTGLPLDPYFAAPKMTWLRQNVCRDGVVTTTDTWLLARLCGSYVTDATTASRTLLLDLDRAEWSAEACDMFGIDPAELPHVTDCAGIVGTTSAFGPELPIAGLAVDQQAALVAEHCLAPGEAKCTYGTGAFLLASTGAKAVRSQSGLSSSVAWRLDGRPAYCLDGQVYTAGAAVQWLVELGLLSDAGELDAIGGTVHDSQGVTFVPALAGLGAPHWSPAARGAFLGLSLATSRAHMIRAVIDGLACSVALLAAALAQDLGAPLAALRVDGGLTRSRLLLQEQADLLQVPVQVSRTHDATALGVAALARIGMGVAPDLGSAVGPGSWESVFEPRISAAQAAERLSAFELAVESVLALYGAAAG